MMSDLQLRKIESFFKLEGDKNDNKIDIFLKWGVKMYWGQIEIEC